MFNPNDLDYTMSAAALRAADEDALADAIARDDAHDAAVRAYEDTYEETPHCVMACSAHDATAHAPACQAAQDARLEQAALAAAIPAVAIGRWLKEDTMRIAAEAARQRALTAAFVAEMAALPEVA